MRTAVTIAIVAGTAVLGFSSRRAQACSCDNTMRVTPAHGAIGVPLDIEIVVDSGQGGFPSGPPPYVLAGPDGPVPIEVERVVDQAVYTIDLIRPTAPLDPLTEYLLVDGNDMASLRDVSVAFTTGSDVDVIAPPSVTLGDLTLAYAETEAGFSFSCGDEYYFVDLAIDAPEEAVGVDLFVGSSRYVITAEKIPWGLTSWNDSCGVAIELVPGAEQCIEARARDLAGNLSEPTVRCATVMNCPNIGIDDDFAPDLTGCNDPGPEAPASSAGCSVGDSSPSSGLPFVAVTLLFGLNLRSRRSIASRRRRCGRQSSATPPFPLGR